MIIRIPVLLGIVLLSAAPSSAASFHVVSYNQLGFAGATDVSAGGSFAVTYNVESYGGGSIYRVGSSGGSSTTVASGYYINPGGVSGDGSIVVGGRSLVEGSYSSLEAFRWQGGSLTTLGSGTRAAIDISADGSTIVGYGDSGAFMHQGGVVTYLPDLPGGRTSAYAWDVSGDGSVIVGEGSFFEHPSSGTEAFRWQGGVMTGLGDLLGGAFSSAAYGITLDGSVIVGRGTGASGGEAFRWQSGVMTGLGQLGALPTIAEAVSADGSTIVGYADEGNVYDGIATIWDAQHGMRDLQAVLEQEFGLDLSDYELNRAFGISSDGLTIAGTGHLLAYPAGQIGWVVTIPEPGTASLLGLGLLGLAGWRRGSA